MKITFLSLNKVKMESADIPFTVALKGHMQPANLNAIYFDTKIEASCSVITSIEMENNSHADLAVQKMRQGRLKTDEVKEIVTKAEFLEDRLRTWKD